MSLSEGLHFISTEEYDADPAPEPSLRSSDARLLLQKTPLHLYHKHPRLGGTLTEKSDPKFDIGLAAHTMMTGQGIIGVLPGDFKDYRKKEAQKIRDDHRERGHIPMLESQYARVEAMVHSGREQLKRTEECKEAFTRGKGEATLIWQDMGVWCRCRLDWLPDNRNSPYPDYKTTEIASPEAWARYAFRSGMDVQAAMYRRGVRRVLEVADPQWRWIVQEVEPPFPLAVVAMTPYALDLADRRFESALNIYGECMGSKSWPAYPQKTCYVDPPAWLEAEWMEMERE